MPNSATFHFGQFQDAGARTSLAELAFSEANRLHQLGLQCSFYADFFLLTLVDFADGALKRERERQRERFLDADFFGNFTLTVFSLYRDGSNRWHSGHGMFHSCGSRSDYFAMFKILGIDFLAKSFVVLD